MKVLNGEHHPSRGRHLQYLGNKKPGLFLDLIKSLMTARSKAARNCSTRRVGMERADVRFPYARGCMIDSWIIPSKRIQNSGLMSILTEKNPKRTLQYLKKPFDICIKDGDAPPPKPGIELQTCRTHFLSNARSASYKHFVI